MKHVKPGRTAAVVRTVTATFTNPTGPAPLDTAPTGDQGGAGDAGGTGTAVQDAPAGQAPAGDPASGGRDADADLLITPPAGAPGGTGDVAPGGGASEGAQQQQAAVAAAAAGQTPIESLPEDVQAMIRDLRKENGENRVKAKTAAEQAEAAAAEKLKAQQEEWIGNLLKAAGLMPDVADQAAAELTPQEQVQALTEQLGQRDELVQAREARYREVSHELALWKGADEHGADPQKLADSVSFMRTVAGLDPDADDYADQVSAAIAAAVSSNEYLKRAQVAPATAPVQTSVASGADGFAGGPRGGTSTEPQGIEAHRASLRERRGR
jgi:hypothetical protein